MSRSNSAKDPPFGMPRPLEDSPQLLLASLQVRDSLGAAQDLCHRLKRNGLSIEERRQRRVFDDGRVQRRVRASPAPERRPGRMTAMIPFRPAVSIAVVSRRRPRPEGQPQRAKALLQERSVLQHLMDLEGQDSQERRTEQASALPGRTRSGIDLAAGPLTVPEAAQHVRRGFGRSPQELEQGAVRLERRGPIPAFAVVAAVAGRREAAVWCPLADDRQARAERPGPDQTDQSALLGQVESRVPFGIGAANLHPAIVRTLETRHLPVPGLACCQPRLFEGILGRGQGRLAPRKRAAGAGRQVELARAAQPPGPALRRRLPSGRAPAPVLRSSPPARWRPRTTAAAVLARRRSGAERRAGRVARDGNGRWRW